MRLTRMQSSIRHLMKTAFVLCSVFAVMLYTHAHVSLDTLRLSYDILQQAIELFGPTTDLGDPRVNRP